MTEKLTIEFATREEMTDFVQWLSRRGEQDYWQWCNHPSDPAAKVDFVYSSDGLFLPNNTITTTPVPPKEQEDGPPCDDCNSTDTVIKQRCMGFTTWRCRECGHTSIKHHMDYE